MKPVILRWPDGQEREILIPEFDVHAGSTHIQLKNGSPGSVLAVEYVILVEGAEKAIIGVRPMQGLPS